MHAHAMIHSLTWGLPIIGFTLDTTDETTIVPRVCMHAIIHSLTWGLAIILVLTTDETTIVPRLAACDYH
eukprot:1308982-Amorphochlora_amoeboformis.AAC.1